MKNITKTFNNRWRKLANSREYREAFVSTFFKADVPFQIRTLRKQRGWSQAQLAAAANLTQGVISRAEDPDYGNLAVNTILRIAAGLDVAFLGTFIPFSDLLRWRANQSEDSIRVPSFEEEHQLFQSGQLVPERRTAPDQKAAIVGFCTGLAWAANTLSSSSKVQEGNKLLSLPRRKYVAKAAGPQANLGAGLAGLSVNPEAQAARSQP